MVSRKVSRRRFVASTADVTISADRTGTGTNALFLKGTAVTHFPFRYGRHSFYRHCELSGVNRHELRVVVRLVTHEVLQADDDVVPSDSH